MKRMVNLLRGREKKVIIRPELMMFSVAVTSSNRKHHYYRNMTYRLTTILFSICLICFSISVYQPSALEAAITLNLFSPEYSNCGNVSINGYVGTTSGTITHLSWDWGDGVVADSWFPASHHYATNGSYTVTVTAFASTGETQSSSTTLNITNAEDPLCSSSLLTPEYLACGNVSINGCVGTSSCINCSIARFSWNWGDGIVADSWFPASHRYRANGSYTVTVTAFCSTGETQSSSTTVNITNAEDPLCNYGLFVYPTTVILHGGKTSETLSVELRDADGAPVSLSGKTVSFSSSNPTIVQVDSSGVVTGSGFGEAWITITVGGFPLTAKAFVFAGEFRIEPPILLLSPNGQPTGQLNLEVANADGSPLNLAGRTVTFHGSNAVAQVNNNGLVTALRPPQSFNETPSISAKIDNIQSHNNAVIRVTSNPLNLNMLALQESNINFYIAQQIGSFNYQQIFQDFDVPRITNIAYQLEEEVCGLVPFKGDMHYFVNDPGHGNDGYNTIPCGVSGNPVRLGSDVDKSTHNSCLIVAFQPATPQWGIFFHEMAHNFTFASLSFGQFANSSDVANSNFTYMEGLATTVSMYVGQMMSERANLYQIPANILSTIMSSVWHFGSTPDLDAYVNGGANYSTINPSVLDDIILVIADKYGYSLLPRFFSVFLPPDASFGRFALSKSDSSQATFFVASMSAAVETDLRADFRNKWGFPIDDLSFNQLYPELRRLIAQQEPVVPGAPTGVLATAGNAQAVVSFTPPVSDGASPIISYTATSNPGNISATAASSPITVTGLTNGVAYTFTVTATNAFGTGPASLPSNSVTPSSTNITVTSPDGGEVWQRGTTQTIRWTYSGSVGSYVKIELLKGGVFNRLISKSTSIGSGGNGSYNWNISSTQTPGNDYRVRVTSTTNSSYQDTSNNNFTIGSTATYSISGRVATSGGTGISGVTMTLSGAGSGTTTTDGSGNYSFSGLANGNYTITPSMSGYTFTPTSRNVTISGANVTGQDFTGTPSGSTYSISGTVTSGGNPLSGVTMTLSGTGSGTTTTDGSGNYSFSGLANGSYTVTPSMTGYTFSPTSRNVTISGANVTGQDFTGTPTAIGITVSVPDGGETWQPGTTQTIRWTYSGSVGSYVKIELLKGGVFNRLISKSTSIGSGGNGSYNWNISSTQTPGNDYRVRVTSTTNSSYQDTSNNNFTIGSTATYSISGRVATSGGTGISGVTMTLSGAGSGTTTTDSNGNYSFTGLSDGSYTVTPSKTGYTFTPTSQNVTISGANVTGQDFVGTGGGTPTLVSIAVTPANPSISVGATQQFTATGTYSDGTTQNMTTQVTWTSSNTSIATVNNSGLVTAVAEGTATITATSGSISGNTTLTVTGGGTGSLLDGSTQYTGTLPPTISVTYPTKSGDTLILDGAYAGFVSLLADPLATQATILATIQANGGTVIAKIPLVGLYLVQVPSGKESTFLSAMYVQSWVEDGSPAAPSALGKIDVLDWDDPLDPEICLQQHESFVAQIADRLGESVTMIDVKGLGSDWNITTGLPREMIMRMENAATLGKRLVINMSLQSEASGTIPSTLDRTGCSDVDCRTIRHQQIIFYYGFFKSIEQMLLTKPSVADNAIVMIIAGNAGVDLDNELQALKKRFPNAFKRVRIIGGTDVNGNIEHKFSHLTDNTVCNIAYARGVDVHIGTKRCSGTSFASPEVAGVLDYIWSKTPALSSDRVIDAFEQALVEKGTNCIIPHDNKGFTTQDFLDRAVTIAENLPPTQKPNLTPYQPAGWSDKIVVSNVQGTNTDSSPLLSTDMLYVDWAVINSGPVQTAARFYTQLYVDGVLKTTWYTDPPLNANYYTSATDEPIGSLSAGTHTIKIVVDSTNAIDESNESDNEYTKTITVTGTQPSCTYTYSEWSACQPDGIQTRTVISSSPPGCVGTPVLTQPCTPSCNPCTPACPAGQHPLSPSCVNWCPTCIRCDAVCVSDATGIAQGVAHCFDGPDPAFCGQTP